jgi:hypothetical protein
MQIIVSVLLPPAFSLLYSLPSLEIGSPKYLSAFVPEWNSIIIMK